MPRPIFYKLIVPSTIRGRQLRIPESFLRKFRDELSNILTLTLPDGQAWRIGLKKADNKAWLCDGWQNFAERYSIRAGYLLMFRYEGNSSFTVYIFNLIASEISYQSPTLVNAQGSYFANQHRIFDEMEDEDPLDILSSLSGLAHGAVLNRPVAASADQMTAAAGKSYGNSPPLQNLFNGSRLDSVNWEDGRKLHTPKVPKTSTKDIGVQFNAMEFKRSADEVRLIRSNPETETPKTKKQGRKKRKVDPDEEDSSVQNGDETETRIRFYESASARKRTVTAEERERAVNAAKAFEPPNPFCRVVLRPSYLYRGCIMYLPSCFAEKHLNGVSGFIKLQLSDGRQWQVRCLYRGGRAKLSQGWYEFSLKNNLGEGDVCVFELLKMKDVVLKVTLFRVIEEAGLLTDLLQPHDMSQTKLISTPSDQQF